MRFRRKCKKKDCYKKTDGTNPYCNKHAAELEMAATRILIEQNRHKQND